MVFGGNRSDCSTVVFPRMGHGMGQNQKAEQGREELNTLRPVSVIRRFDERTPVISFFWYILRVMFHHDFEQIYAGFAPLSQRKGLCR